MTARYQRETAPPEPPPDPETLELLRKLKALTPEAREMLRALLATDTE
jgi:hypothetical protein